MSDLILKEFEDVFAENLCSLLEILSVPKTADDKLNRFLVKLPGTIIQLVHILNAMKMRFRMYNVDCFS